LLFHNNSNNDTIEITGTDEQRPEDEPITSKILNCQKDYKESLTKV